MLLILKMLTGRRHGNQYLGHPPPQKLPKFDLENQLIDHFLDLHSVIVARRHYRRNLK